MNELDLTAFEKRHLNRKPDRITKSEVLEAVAALVGIGLALMVFLHVLGYFHFEILSPWLEVKAAELPKSEAEWIADICSNLDAYQNGDQFADYCAGV